MTCPYCEAVGGTCWPHRANVLRLLDLPEIYGPAILRWGAEGSPADTDMAGEPDPAQVQAAPAGRFDAAAHKANKARVDACAFRGCRVGCQLTRCSLYAREVYWGDCSACCRGRPPGSFLALPPPA